MHPSTPFAAALLTLCMSSAPALAAPAHVHGQATLTVAVAAVHVMGSFCWAHAADEAARQPNTVNTRTARARETRRDIVIDFRLYPAGMPVSKRGAA